ncbi:unnamed protein product [Phytophthora lilii]|uniref:RxLR effector protein n=1 Tax=Phytophthora lilii TaxID=2077276 RepID=A0A9W6XLM8_9STRA|nr:unnamed protein product [Phytophthora lilii]
MLTASTLLACGNAISTAADLKPAVLSVMVSPDQVDEVNAVRDDKRLLRSHNLVDPEDEDSLDNVEDGDEERLSSEKKCKFARGENPRPGYEMGQQGVLTYDK